MSYLGFKHTDETKNKIRLRAIGRKAHNKLIWTSKNPTQSSCSRRAKDIYGIPKKCELCKETKGLQIHHKDVNPKNNNRDNLMALCVKCHIKKHPRKYPPCGLCGVKSKAKGYCEKHYLRFKAWGNPYMVKMKNGPVVMMDS